MSSWSPARKLIGRPGAPGPRGTNRLPSSKGSNKRPPPLHPLLPPDSCTPLSHTRTLGHQRRTQITMLPINRQVPRHPKMLLGPRLFQHFQDQDNPLVTSLISAWPPAHKALDTTTLRNSISRMLQRDVCSTLASDSKAIQKKNIKPIRSFITQVAVRRLWDSTQPQDALQMLRHLPQEISIIVPASCHGPSVDL